ncbi:MAG: hypothetical protein ABSG04_09945 [Verrucomicrobiota bacterium]|jgi:hypothetical protein
MAAPSDSNRPSAHEICKKVQDALWAIQANRRVLGVTKHLLSDFDALEISSETELWEVLPRLMQEIINAKPPDCYCHLGGHPPRRSTDEQMKNMELWPYRWRSPSQGKMMFLKFAMRRDRKGDWWYIHVDVHEDRPQH